MREERAGRRVAAHRGRFEDRRVRRRRPGGDARDPRAGQGTDLSGGDGRRSSSASARPSSFPRSTRRARDATTGGRRRDGQPVAQPHHRRHRPGEPDAGPDRRRAVRRAGKRGSCRTGRLDVAIVDGGRRILVDQAGGAKANSTTSTFVQALASNLGVLRAYDGGRAHQRPGRAAGARPAGCGREPAGDDLEGRGADAPRPSGSSSCSSC